MRAALCRIVAISATVFSSSAHGSQDSLGPNGINSLGLGLTGDMVAVGQVEDYRSAKTDYDSIANSNTFIDPLYVQQQDRTSEQNEDLDSDDMTGVSDPLDDHHATWVAGLIISSDPDLTGVAPNANLNSASFRSPNVITVGPHEEIIRTTQSVARRFIPPVDPTKPSAIRAINHSYGFFESAGETLDGNGFLTLGMDWISSRYNMLNVVAGNQGFDLNWSPSDHFNGLTVAFSAKNAGGVYSKVGALNRFDLDAIGPRTSVDILAPGEAVVMGGRGNVQSPTGADAPKGTSFATPHVTGSIALLNEYAGNQIRANTSGWTPEAHRHEVIKAVILNSADKLNGVHDSDRTIVNKSGEDWTQSPAYTNDGIALDIEMGAGHLNVTNAIKQFSSGDQDVQSSQNAIVPPIGWLYERTVPPPQSPQPPCGCIPFNDYTINETLVGNNGSGGGEPPGEPDPDSKNFIAITLTWDRKVEIADGSTRYEEGDDFVGSQLNNLDLFLMKNDGSNEIVAQSTTTDNNVEHIFTNNFPTGDYKIRVRHNGGLGEIQFFALAWWYEEGEIELDPGDFDGDGDVDSEDLSDWETNYGDGDTDGADFLAWQRNLTGPAALAAASSSTAVPEPSSIFMAMLGLPLILSRRENSSL